MGGTAQELFRSTGIAKRLTKRKARTAHAPKGHEPPSLVLFS